MGGVFHLKVPTLLLTLMLVDGYLFQNFYHDWGDLDRPFILKLTKFIDLVMKLPEILAKGLEILEKFCRTNRPFCQSPDSRRVTVTIK